MGERASRLEMISYCTFFILAFTSKSVRLDNVLLLISINVSLMTLYVKPSWFVWRLLIVMTYSKFYCRVSSHKRRTEWSLTKKNWMISHKEDLDDLAQRRTEWSLTKKKLISHKEELNDLAQRRNWSRTKKNWMISLKEEQMRQAKILSEHKRQTKEVCVHDEMRQ